MRLFATVLAAGLLAATPAWAARLPILVVEKAELAAPPDKVWAAVKDFDSLHKWNPVFSNTELTKGKNNVKGAQRVLTLKDGGGKITEELMAYSERGMKFKYRILEAPLPITDYVSTIKVTKRKGGGSVVTWSGYFKGKDDKPAEGADDASLKKTLSGVYTAGLNNLKTMLK